MANYQDAQSALPTPEIAEALRGKNQFELEHIADHDSNPEVRKEARRRLGR